MIGKTSAELDLRNQQAVNDFFKHEKPEGVNETATVISCNNPLFQLELGKKILSIDPAYFRPTEVDLLIGDPTKAKEKLGWVPEHDLPSLVKDMMQADVKLMQKDQYLKKGGYSANNYYE